jgi:glycosyltransferase involved in cell wall biosynthesis
MYHNSSIQVIGNPIKQVNPQIKEGRDNIILAVGRLINSKHHSELIQLFAKLNQQGWKLVIVGGDALRQSNFEKLNKLIKTLSLEDQVKLTGSIKDVDFWYRKARIFAFPSSSEGFPNVVGEALAHGLPVVAFDCVAGPRDLIQHGQNGFLIETLNFEDFAKHLHQLMTDDDLLKTLAENAPNSVLSFCEEEIAHRFYQGITNHH